MDEQTSRAIRRSDEHYTPIAKAYTTSAIHSQGRDLARMVELAGELDGARVLDVGTGTGHTGLRFAAAGARVIGLDLTAAMLREARALAEERGASFVPVQGLAESLPFVGGSFDVVACRYCAHHFLDIPAAIGEWRRVLRPGGTLVFVDHVAPEDAAADAFVNRIDWLRDPSHRREPRLSEYDAWLTASGFVIAHVKRFSERMVLDEWFARARTSADREREARDLLATASPALQAEFSIAPDGFDLRMVLLVARVNA